MPEPYNYALNVPNPTQAVLQGVQLAGGLAETRAAQTKAAAVQLETDRRKAFNADVAKIAANPTAAGYASLAARYPESAAVLKESYGLLSAEEQKERITQASSVYSALSAGEYEFAQETLTKQAEAYRAAGREKDAKQLEDLAKLVELSPETAQTTAGLYLATNMGAEKFVEGFSKLEAERRTTAGEAAELTKKEADAKTAAARAKFADSEAALDLQKKGWDITKIQNDIQVARENSRIAALNADIAKEGNELKKKDLELRRDEFSQKRDQLVRERSAAATTARATADNLINSVDELLNMSAVEVFELGSNGTRTKKLVANDDLKRVTGTYDSKTPTFREKSGNIEKKLENIRSQIALGNVDKLTGSISDKDLVILKESLQALDTSITGDELVKSLSEVRRLTLKARENISTKYGIPETVPDTASATAGKPSQGRPPLGSFRR